jgi:GTP-binding protein Era
VTEEAERPFRSGFAALVGRPNAGKSTLVNAIVGTKVAIVSDKPQTTRHRLRAIVDRPDAQVVFVDTPGLHKPIDALGEELNASALMSLRDVDVACLLIDASQPVGGGDAWVAAHVAAAPAAKLLILTKADLVDETTMARQLAAARALAGFDEVLVTSAVEGFNVDGVLATVERLLPEGPRYFPEGMSTDQPIETMLAEFVREKVLERTREEVPHAVGVAVDDIEVDEKTGFARVGATIYVERDSQKGIIVGKGGEMIRAVGTTARKDIEELLGLKVHLDLRVKVRAHWRSDAEQVRRFGYGQGL